MQIIKNLSERITWLTQRVGSLAITKIEDRLYRVLTSIAEELGSVSHKGTATQFPLIHKDLSLLTLSILKSRGFKLAILSNGTPRMLDAAVNSAGIEKLIEHISKIV